MRIKPIADRPELTALLKASVAKVATMTPEERAKMIAQRRRSWVVGEMMLEHPHMTKEQANELYDQVILNDKENKP